MQSDGKIFPYYCHHCGKENPRNEDIGCIGWIGQENERLLSTCVRPHNSPGNGWEQALTRGKTPRLTKTSCPIYQVKIPYEQNGYNKPEAEYLYLDKATKHLITVKVFRQPDGSKDCIPYAHINGEQKPGYKKYGIKREDIPIYEYIKVREAISQEKPIYIVEGEKCVRKLIDDLNLIATCNIGGAGTNGNNWKPSDTACLEGAKEIILCPDQDKPGILHMEAIYKQLIDYGFPDSSIKWLYAFPDSKEWDNIPEKKGLDIFDWIESGVTYQQILSSIQNNKREITIDSNRVYIDTKESVLSSKMDETKNQEIRDKLKALFYTQDGKRKKPDHTTFLKALYTIYGKKLRYNLQTFEPWLDNQSFEEVEGELNNVYLKLQHTYGLFYKKEEVKDGILLLAQERKFHPVEEYLKDVAKNVEPIDIDNLATRYLGVDTELANTYIKLWLLAAAARPIYPGCYVRNVPILQGKQNIGKSTFFRILGGEHFCDSLGDCKDKDQKMIAHGKHIHEWAEFEKLWRKSLRSEVKAFITAKEDTFRLPYGRTTKTHKRRFVLCGTSNEEQFLKDPTGNDRFWIISVKQKIALEQLKKERDAIWSAAARIVLNANPDEVMDGKPWELPEHLLETNRKNTAKYEEIHEWEHLLQEVITSWGDSGWIFSDKLWDALEIENKDRGRHSNTFSDIMRKFGWKKGGTKRVKDSKAGEWKTHRIWIPIDSE